MSIHLLVYNPGAKQKESKQTSCQNAHDTHCHTTIAELWASRVGQANQNGLWRCPGRCGFTIRNITLNEEEMLPCQKTFERLTQMVCKLLLLSPTPAPVPAPASPALAFSSASTMTDFPTLDLSQVTPADLEKLIAQDLLTPEKLEELLRWAIDAENLPILKTFLASHLGTPEMAEQILGIANEQGKASLANEVQSLVYFFMERSGSFGSAQSEPETEVGEL